MTLFDRFREIANEEIPDNSDIEFFHKIRLIQRCLNAICAELGHDWPAEPITGTGDGDYIKGATLTESYKELRAIGPCRICGKEEL